MFKKQIGDFIKLKKCFKKRVLFSLGQFLPLMDGGNFLFTVIQRGGPSFAFYFFPIFPLGPFWIFQGPSSKLKKKGLGKEKGVGQGMGFFSYFGNPDSFHFC